jgi:hypothetical protein
MEMVNSRNATYRGPIAQRSANTQPDAGKTFLGGRRVWDLLSACVHGFVG